MNDANRRPLALIILDGWGHKENCDRNALSLANTPNYDEICRSFPMTTLIASGPRVGLPKGSSGGPESGHLNLGAGRVTLTDEIRIENSIESGEFFQNQVLIQAMQDVRNRGASLHIAGLLSDAGVHSTPESLFAVLRLAKRQALPQVYIHCFLDGHDVPVKTADIYVEALEVKINEIGIGKIASLCGRHFAMDAHGNWERTARAYTMMVHAEGEGVPDAKTAIRNAFLRGYTDQFISPIVIEQRPGVPVATLKDGDLIILFNHRGDGMRQLANAIAASGEGGGMPFLKPRIDVVSMTEYDPELKMAVAYPPEANKHFLTQVLAENGVSNCMITESERATHLGNLFIGQTGSMPLATEVFNSVDPALRGMKPEMASFKIADKFISELDSGDSDVFVVNIPAPAVIAETGSFENTIEAIQYADTCLGGIIEKVREKDGVAVITASHAGCEDMTRKICGAINHRSTGNPVPFHLVDDRGSNAVLREDGTLEDVAPTILGILGVEKPVEMTGRDLRH